MNPPVIVHIIGAPIACKEGVRESWRDIAAWAAEQLRQRFGERVTVQYYDLFDPACPALPDGAQLPLVLVNGALLTNGGKVSVPALRKKIEMILQTKSA